MKMKNTVKIAMSVLFAASLSTQAAVLIVSGATTDNRVDELSGAPGFTGDQNIRIGRSGLATDNDNLVFVFELPALGGENIVDANLQLFVEVANNFESDFNVDLYGIRSSASSAVLGSDYFEGALDGSNTLLQDDILSPALGNGSIATTVNTDAGGDSSLSSWIASLYSGGAVAGEFAFIRLNHDANPLNNNRYYQVSTADNAVSGERPVLTLNTAVAAAPEPSSLALLGMGVAILMMKRKKSYITQA